ncbi:alpha/beta hydrolase [Runella sp.]|uniref:alpha/beta hydrolase n=1 Tax=Runella sp. TaxID=1960881 RepID=UPI00261D6C1E|nr:alpha/beta hydrolase [Runella sp.]
MKNSVFKCSFLVFILLVFFSYFINAQERPIRDYAAEESAKLEPDRKILYKTVDEKELYLHFFEPEGYKNTDKRSCFIAIHGGAWTGGEPSRFYSIINEFVKKGMVGISIQYRLIKKGESTVVFYCVKNGRTGLRYIRQHADELGINPQKIIVSGGSAGSHIAAGTALFNESNDNLSISPVPNALVLYYPVIDTSPEGYGNKVIGEHWQKISPLHQVRAGLPPTIIFHGTGDTVTPYQGAKAFCDTMLNTGNRCELYSNEGRIHGYMMFEKKFYQEAMMKTSVFLKSLNFEQ